MKKKQASKPTRKPAKVLRLKQNAVQAELTVTQATAATFKGILRRLDALEKRAGVPGPAGPKGDPGVGFWG